MYEKKYEVLIDDKVVAEYMSLDIALILIQALFETYYNDDNMKISIKEMDKTYSEDTNII